MKGNVLTTLWAHGADKMRAERLCRPLVAGGPLQLSLAEYQSADESSPRLCHAAAGREGFLVIMDDFISPVGR